ncbi:MAG: hypothetical protein IIW54_12050 [Lachnospiraceae bacterium]|nr:hypothetical protein [Lachnospiraceae bacterium]
MLPWWQDSITVYHRVELKNRFQRTEMAWKSEQCNNCFYKEEQKQSMDGNSLVNGTIRFVRIPKLSMPLNKGDIIVKGIVHDIIPYGSSGKELLDKYQNAFKVNVIKDNSGIGLPLPHVYGSE